MSGAPDARYVVARSVLLDALEALGAQREAVVLVGAQAIYMYTGALELAVAEFTTDGDLTIDPALLQRSPEIESAMHAAHFRRGKRVGSWVIDRDIDGVPTEVEIDLMVPEAVGGVADERHAFRVMRRRSRARRVVWRRPSSTSTRPWSPPWMRPTSGPSG